MRIPDGEGPNRTCIATRECRPASAMVRFVAAPDGAVTPDLKRKLPGRGVWVTATAEAVAAAVKKKAFARALKTPVTAPDDLAETVGRLMERDALQALAMANKAGCVVAGAAKIEGGAGKGYAALVHAADASEAGVEKLERAVRSRMLARRSDAHAIPSVRLFLGSELSLSLGREHVIHAALVVGPPSRNFIGKALAAERYRRNDPAPPARLPELTAGDDAGICISTKDQRP